MDKAPKAHERSAEADLLLKTVMDLHEQVAKINPGLIVSVQFGDKLRHPSLPKGKEDFRDFANKPSEPFRSSFDKVGDGFADVHSLDINQGFESLPALRSRMRD